MKNRLFHIALCLLLPLTLYATDVSVRVFSDQNISKMRFTVEFGQYRLLDGNQRSIIDLPTATDVEFTVRDGKIDVVSNGKKVGTYPNLIMEGVGLKAIMGLQPIGKNIPKRYYDDHLDVSVEKGSLFLINHVNLENYVAGVVQSEVRGISDQTDFFKVQAIISRTYAMNNLLRHKSEGYDLCDGVHCQVYHSRNNTPIILTATVQSAGLVIVDEQDNLITASFYSNSGGQTANSEDVWTAPVSYLRSVPDTFSMSMKNAYWTKEMTRDEWLGFLNKTYNYNIKDPVMRDSALSFTQEQRKSVFPGGIPLKNIRRDLNLRSTFFSVKTEGRKVTLMGRGYGHGVGLSQEGVVRMIDLGYSVREVIEHYYTGVKLRSLEEMSEDVMGE